MADGRHIENTFFIYISTIYCPINVKFDTKKQNYVQIH